MSETAATAADFVQFAKPSGDWGRLTIAYIPELNTVVDFAFRYGNVSKSREPLPALDGCLDAPEFMPRGAAHHDGLDWVMRG